MPDPFGRQQPCVSFPERTIGASVVLFVAPCRIWRSVCACKDHDHNGSEDLIDHDPNESAAPRDCVRDFASKLWRRWRRWRQQSTTRTRTDCHVVLDADLRGARRHGDTHLVFDECDELHGFYRMERLACDFRG